MRGGKLPLPARRVKAALIVAVRCALIVAVRCAVDRHSLYAAYHSHHHASFVPEPVTGSVHPFGEHLMYTANFAIPLVGTWLWGGASIAMLYIYLIGFDLVNEIGHCNFEFFPVRVPPPQCACERDAHNPAPLRCASEAAEGRGEC